MKRILAPVLLPLILALLSPGLAQTAQVTDPETFFGFKPGSDFKLLGYEESIGYLERLASESARIVVFDMGATGSGRRMKYAAISSDENVAELDRFKEISRKLSLVRGVSGEQAEELAREGRAIVWIDGGIHREEVVGAQMIPQMAYEMVTGEDGRTKFIRENVIVLLAFANPDGMAIVTDWYMKHVGTRFEYSPIPWRNLKLGGTNRDAYMSHLEETRNMNRAILHEWQPVIYHNQHQTGPFPARIFIPPEGEPTNANVHPLVIREKTMVGAAMGEGLDEAGLPGAISRSAYDTWFPGYATQAPEGHNIPGILTETQSNRTEINRLGRATPHYWTVKDFPEEYQGLLKGIFYPSPWTAGWWRLADQMRYNITAAKSELYLAAKYREEFLLNKWRMGKDTIDRFQEEGPYGWIIPAQQADREAASDLIERMQLQNFEVWTADQEFEYGGQRFAAGSYVMLTSQPFGLYLKNLFEIQHHPDLRQHSHLWQALPRLVKYDAEPMRPYDNVGWTLPLLMGVESCELLKPLEIKKSPVQEPARPEGIVQGKGRYYLASARDGNSFRAASQVLKDSGDLFRTRQAYQIGGEEYPTGSFLLPSGGLDPAKLAGQTGVTLRGIDEELPSAKVAAPRIGVYKSWVRSEDAASCLWLLERYGFRFSLVDNGEVRGGKLNDRYDVILLPDQGSEVIVNGYERETVPPEYAGGIGDEGIRALQRFVRQGGTLICNRMSSELVLEHFHPGITNTLKGVSPEEFNCPGSIIKVRYAEHPVTRGMDPEGAVFFSGSGMRDAVFEGGFAFEVNDLKDDGTAPLVRPIATYPEEELLLSGWFIGDERIRGTAAAVELQLGSGRVFLFGFNLINRGHSYVTFKLLLNALLAGRP